MRFEASRKSMAVLVTMVGMLPSLGRAAGVPQMPEPLENVVIPDKPPGAHWVWLGDFQNGQYARSVLYDADQGAILGMIDTGWEGIKLDIPRKGNEIYNLAMFMSRGYRGERTDTVAAYDPRTLKLLREFVVPAKGIHGWPDVNHTALSDDDRFMWMQFFTPASSIGVADLTGNRYVGEFETSGCAHVMSAGPRQVFTLCGDGGALAITVGDDGQEVTRKRYPGLFDPDKDPLHGSGTRSGSTWYFVSHRGRVHEVRVGNGELRFGQAWPISDVEGDKTWVPGPMMQTVAVHDAKRRLYVLMHPSDLKPKGGGADFHRESGTEVWIFDLDTKKRLKRMPLTNPGSAVAVSQDAAPYVYVTAMGSFVVTPYDEASGRAIRDISIPTFPTLIQPVR